MYKRQDTDAAQERESAIPNVISVRNAVKVIYFLMAVDGEVYHGEEEKFDAIGADLISDFGMVKASILDECQAEMEKMIDPEDYYDVFRTVWKLHYLHQRNRRK